MQPNLLIYDKQQHGENIHGVNLLQTTVGIRVSIKKYKRLAEFVIP